MNICLEAATYSSKFENNNTELKKKYIIENIKAINDVMQKAPGYFGSFGTRYPFYALGDSFVGDLPVIDEQIRYNNDLIHSIEAAKLTHWPCEKCLTIKGHLMPDLKQVCLPCPQIDNSLKPRKVINRLPDIDMWMVCSDLYVDKAKDYLLVHFNEHNMHTSDIDPLQTIYDFKEITDDIENGKMPSKMLPLDIHIIEYSKLSHLIDEIPFVLQSALVDQNIPYLPILPISLRKTWQNDDEAYNFVVDFLYSMTDFNFEKTLKRKLDYSRKIVSNAFDHNQLKQFLFSASKDSVKRRFENPVLQKRYCERVELWKKE